MAQQFTTDSGVVLTIPGTYVQTDVIANQGGTAAAGVVTLIGEADQGPDFTQESNLDGNAFGPDNIAAVISKYQTGHLVDAFREIAAAASDPNIVGSVSLVKIVKTNPSTKAASEVTRNGFGNYGELEARRAGQPGNLIKYNSDISIAEVAPTTGLFSYTPIYTGSVAWSLRQNGSALESITTASLVSGPSFASSIENLSNGTLAAGGIQLAPLTGLSGNISVSVISTPNSIIQISIPGQMTTPNIPSPGDSMVIPLSGQFGAASDSSIIGAANANEGSYVILTVSNTGGTSTITAQRINTPSGNVAAVSATPITATTDIICYTQIQVQNITGMDRQSTVGLSAVNFNTTSNANGIFTMTISPSWAAEPEVGDYVKFAGSFAGVTAGFYQVTAATSGSFTCQRLSNGSSGTTGTNTTAGPITQGSQPFIVSKPTIDGLGKSTEINGTLSSIARDPETTAAADFATGNPLLTSASEYENSFTVSQNNTSNTFLSGGDIVATFSCDQESATMVVSASGIAFKVGSTTLFTLTYDQYPTLQNIVDFVQSQSTFYAEVSTAQWNLLASSALDYGTYKLSSSEASSNMPGRIKNDSNEFQQNSSQSGLTNFTPEDGTQSGLPEVIEPPLFLSGGTKAGSTSGDFASAIDACEGVDTNFLVPCISQNASLDILQGQTDPSSTYSIDAVNAAMKSHVILMSTLQARKNRIAIVSKSDTYNNQKIAAAQMSSFRVGMCFQNVNAVSSSGQIATYQPWMASVVAAGMQSAAGYKGIVKKYANITGISSPRNDFNPGIPSQLTDALESGLLILESVKTGGFRWVSDQLTYSQDNNFVYNSLQAVYISDLMALTLIQNFDNSIVGQSVATISASVALGFLQAQLFDFLRLHWIAPSEGAPLGFKNASVRLNGGVLNVYVEVALAGLIYFVPIQFELSQVQQSA